MALPTTKKQCDIRIKSLKKQVTAMEKRKKTLSPANKKAVKRKVAKKVVRRKTTKKATKKKRR